MNIQKFKPYFVVIGLLLVTVCSLAFSGSVRVSDVAGIKVYLPDRVGKWEGKELRFCQNEKCLHEYTLDQLTDPSVCPACGGPLDPMAKGEKEILPKDTVILKKRYTRPDGKGLFVSIVLSGAERASIHRPQVCLVGQGHEVMKSSVVRVPMDNRDPLRVMVLDLLKKRKQQDGKMATFESYYAYWFVGKNRETPYHLQRMIWMTSDRILHNVSHRWAYVAINGTRQEGSEEYLDDLRAFLRDLYPQMVLEKG